MEEDTYGVRIFNWGVVRGSGFASFPLQSASWLYASSFGPYSKRRVE